jgi:hypothetical protein
LLRRTALAIAGTSILAMAGVASAQSPPLPDFYWPYGQVQLDGENITPPVQPVIAFVRGTACGEAESLVATASADTPAEDVGKTVYVVNIRADGSGPGQQPGCGRNGDAVMLYFPTLVRFANETLLFQQGEERVDLSLGPAMPTRLPLPFVSDDGPLE